MASDQASSAPEDQDANDQESRRARSTAATHRRTYQACLPCRRRKVRCDLGSVDEPGDPPCQRCRREKKECVFSETRRKRKADDEDGLGGLTDEYVQRNKRTGPMSAVISDDLNISNASIDPNGPYASAAASNGYNDSLGLDGGKKKGGNLPVRNDAAAALFSRTITMPSDALHMLVDAASRTEDEDRMRKDAQSNAAAIKQENLTPMIDPAIVAMQTQSTLVPDPIMSKAITLWRSVRFVRAGWFTPQEGIAYVQFFYEHLAPLTPVSPPDYSDPSQHSVLLGDEPMLTVTILTIASRYMELKGPGARARSFWIHDKLWTYLQGMVTRMFWGQEQFGGGFCGAGRFRTVEEAEARRRGLRSLGTVESLLLLSDWLPRSMHFPPSDDGDDIMVIGATTNPFDSPEMFAAAPPKNAHSDWTEPAIRSDRMCWSLVGTAYTLAFELGVFDSLIEDGKWTMGRQAKTFYDSERADRIGRLLFVYVSQTCGRLGFPNMMPHQGTEHDFDFLKMDVPPGTYVGPYPSVTPSDRIQRAWAELTALMRQSNTELFESKQRTYDSIKSGEYMQFLEKYVPKLKAWKERFEQTDVPEKARIMLMMEYEYSRTYINSLSLQAVLDNAIETESAEQTNQADGHTPPAFISSKAVDLKEQNKPYISELINASRNLLTLAVEDLHRVGGLRNAPVRTHFRILSGAMFLLKTFALGDTQSEVVKSLRLLDQTIKALRESVPDDVHLSLRISELLSSLTAALRTKFVRLRVDPKGGKRSGTSANKNTTSHPTSGSSNLKSTSTGTNPPSLHPRTFSYTSLGIQPREVDLNDLNTTIMPPPNFPLHNGSFGDSYALVDSPGTPGGGFSPHAGNSGSPRGVRARHGSTSAGNPAFSPTAAFSPLSTGSGGGAQPYDWLTIDINPLLQSINQNTLGNTQSTPNSQSGQMANASAIAPGNAAAIMNSSRGASPNISAPSAFDIGGFTSGGAWTNGAFGPEISEGLEWLGALGTGTGGFGGWEGEGGYP